MFDIMMGGGLEFYIKRADGINIVNYATNKGYNVVQDLAGMNALTGLPAIGLFSMSAMPYAIDGYGTSTPNLPQMTTKALELLQDESPNGFFLLIEGSKIDFAGHNNDAATHWTEIIEYNEALKIVMEWAKEDGNTLVISTSDHETGGLTLGLQWDNETVGTYAWYPQVLLPFNGSTEIMANEILYNNQGISETILEYTGVVLTAPEIALIQQFVSNATYSKLTSQIGKIISSRARVGWTTWVHTGVDTNLYAFGPQSEGLRGHWQNTDVGTYVANILGLDVLTITEKLSHFDPNPPNASLGVRHFDIHQ